MDALLTRLRTALAGRYEVEHELGRGGMAVVFLGRDLRLGRRVAIKVFEQEGGSAQETDRFLREIRVAAQLQHPNILPVHDSGEAEGLAYYIMPYVAGSTLRERLEREGPLPVADATQVARDVALALDHAHQAGIVHRDIKPDNIMLSGGVAAVTDFGIARALEEGGARLTETGMVIGTPTYMSPEQATGERTVDGRADIYALGCVLYEMLAGTPPFTAPTAQAVLARHTTDPVPPLSTLRLVPAALETAVLKCLAKLPADRWSTAGELAKALGPQVTSLRPASRPRVRRVAVAAVGAVVVVLAALTLLRLRAARASGDQPVRVVAVLPFTVRGTDTSRADLADGLTEGVTTALVKAGGFGVLPSGRVQRFRDRVTDPQLAGRELGATTVVSGNVRFSGNTFRLAAALTDVATGRELWAEQFSGELVVAGALRDIFTVQDEIAAMIVDSLRPQLDPAARRRLAGAVRTKDPEAYRLYSDALRLRYSPSLQDHLRVIALLRGALQRDSLFGDAWVALARAYLWSHGEPSDSAERSWRQAAERAIEVDPENPGGYRERSWYHHLVGWDDDLALRDIRHAERLGPGDAEVQAMYAILLSWMNQPDSALAHGRRSVTLDPANALVTHVYANVLAFSGLKDSALIMARRALALDSTLLPPYWHLMNANLDAGRRAAADSAATTVERIGADEPWMLGLLAAYYGRTGNRAGATRVLNHLLALSRAYYVERCIIGAARLATGDRRGALDGLEASANLRDPGVRENFVLMYPRLDGDPRYDTLRQRLFATHPPPRNPYP